ncbi:MULTISPECIES: hypothetical protein [unclassified Clostridioides]|uniref:hypothetical protein n=1 Tax=unclassified Clostridioides TaxID=2635829 RepID=UPI001D0BFA2B|nr:hypothetical protein [Clostridioides sp. ES-S-0171-01]MCC0654714.1 hypothetical protein [Clostridioides sp. ES-S-0001-03]MCC0689699.1 hypothetical protein [Clostridioides sp. ES-S-0056-01]MCC0716803.1 hypothetical protein [Clostridioides sp. ES-S-0077-01]
MQENKEIWLYSWDDEYFESDEYESKEKAVEAAKEELERIGDFEENVYVGKREDVSLPRIDIEDTVERVQELIDDEFGECGEGWITRIEDEDIKILDNELNEVFSKWIDEFGYKPTWFKITDVEEIKLSKGVRENE